MEEKMNKGLDKLNVENLEAVNGGTNQSARPDSTIKTVKRAEKLGIGKKNVTASQLIPGTPGQAENLGLVPPRLPDSVWTLPPLQQEGSSRGLLWPC